MTFTKTSLLAAAIALAFAASVGANDKPATAGQDSSWSKDEKSKQLNDPYAEADRSAKGVSEQSASSGTGLEDSPNTDRSQVSNEGGMNRDVPAGHARFADLDLDRNGSLSRAELRGDIEATRSYLSIDRDRNSTLSESEWTTYTTSTTTASTSGDSATASMDASSGSGSTMAGDTSSDATAQSGATGAGAGPGASSRAGSSRSSMAASSGTRAGAASRHTDADFARLDANRDGKLTQTELGSQSDLSGRWSTIDADGDASLSRAEWDRFVLDGDTE